MSIWTNRLALNLLVISVLLLSGSNHRLVGAVE